MHENICISCFRDKGRDALCPHCGFVESGSRKHSLLPARCVLQGRYLIGEMLTADKNCVCYKAMDMQQKRIVEVQEYFPREIVMRDTDAVTLVPLLGEETTWPDKSVKTILENARKMTAFAGCRGLMHIFEAFEENQTVYVVNEYLEGMLLEDYLKQCGAPLDVPTAMDVILPVLDGLTQLHKADLIHRAVTPKNILITSDNTIKLTNYVFLKEASPFKESAMTVYFSPGYAPYELYVSRERRGAYSDVYSVGAVLYRMLVGKTPPDAIHRMEEDTIRADLQAAGLPQHIVLAICKAMDKNKDVRFKSAAEMKSALLQETPLVDVDAYLEKRRNRKARWIIVGLLAVLAVAAVALCIIIHIKPY